MLFDNNVYAGLDVGDKRVGISFSDALQLTAQPYDVYRRKSAADDAAYFKKLFAEKGVIAIVAGIPLNMNGTEGPQAEKARNFAKKIAEATGLELFFVDERLTSSAAERLMADADVSRQKRSQKVDVLAAVMILQTFLDRRQREKNS